MTEESVFNISKVHKSSETLIETEVFLAAKNGDSAAFGKLYDIYFQPIFRFIYFRTSHQETAEDLAEEVFIKALRGLPKFTGDTDKLSSWLYTIARNVVIDHYRKAGETLPIEALEHVPDKSISALQALQLEADQVLLAAALEKLSSIEKTIITLRFLEGFEIAELATLLSKSEGNIRIIQYRALQKLRTILETSTQDI
jgi:RNA polymerase sigma-70 factor (ECF subfamily)